MEAKPLELLDSDYSPIAAMYTLAQPITPCNHTVYSRSIFNHSKSTVDRMDCTKKKIQVRSFSAIENNDLTGDGIPLLGK
jgi:hypothetical protein